MNERRADEEATATIIPQETLRSFIIRVKPLYSKTRIVQFANRLHIHPGIVTGQLQHLGEITYATNREFLVKVRDLLVDVALTDGWGKSLPVL
jgi:HTH-type transcriptional regulator/antitoxin HigA